MWDNLINNQNKDFVKVLLVLNLFISYRDQTYFPMVKNNYLGELNTGNSLTLNWMVYSHKKKIFIFLNFQPFNNSKITWRKWKKDLHENEGFSFQSMDSVIHSEKV